MQRITQTQITNMQMNLNLNATMTKALVGMVKEYVTEVTTELSKIYGFSLEDALKRLDLENLQPNEKKSAKSEKTRTVKSEKKEPLFLLPYCGVTCEEWCKAVKYNSGLMTQCTKSPESNEAYCKTCAKTVDASSGKPKFGSMHDREKEGWTDPSGKSPVRYATVMSKIKYEGVPVTEEQVNAEVAKMGWTMPQEEWTLEDKQKHRGRPKKSKPMTSGTVGDDMIANLVSQANLQQEADSSQETVSASDQEEEEPESDKKEENADKKEEKSDKKEKEAKKEADKKAKPENSDKKKSKEVALKEATTIAESLAKKTAETNVEKQLLKEEGELSEEEEEEEISVTKFVFQGENYLKDEKNVIYDYESQAEIGIWNGSAIELYDP